MAETVLTHGRTINTGYEIQINAYKFAIQLNFLSRIWINEDPLIKNSLSNTWNVWAKLSFYVF